MPNIKAIFFEMAFMFDTGKTFKAVVRQADLSFLKCWAQYSFIMIIPSGTIIAIHDNADHHPVPNRADSNPNNVIAPSRAGAPHTFLNDWPLIYFRCLKGVKNNRHKTYGAQTTGKPR